MLRFLFFQVAVIAVALPVISTQTITDPVGDVAFDAPAFQDIVRGEMTKSETGDFELLIEVAGLVPVAPPLPTSSNQMWWMWGFDLDPAASPKGYPVPPGAPSPLEVMVFVSWDGTTFAGTAIDRRPLLSGGQAIVTPVTFSVSGAIVEAVLPYALIGEGPSSFNWRVRTLEWSGPVGSGGCHASDGADFNP